MRIITGSARGTRLKSPSGSVTRPTADRVKESLFNILGGCARARVLDLFAGSGALGLEALSRGATKAVFVDKNTARLIAQNAEHTKLDGRAEIYSADVLFAVKKLIGQGARFDLIFCDPPYGKGLIENLSADAAMLLAEDGIFVAEHGADEFPEGYDGFAALRRVRRVSYGRTTAVSFLKR